MDWKREAEVLYFDKHLKINTISEMLGITRQHIGKHLMNCDGYKKEKDMRKRETKKKQREKRKEYDYIRRNHINTEITKETIFREHETAVRILSHERY